ncbi:hypothetical protein [Microbacterium sp. G2-8]|uniref:hypothetical protein n=1 Tax=Microbacterium sp. G2-8 TaxID=2842454 RepID=UPI001C896642|nr:hypothetical protein [Microbacterium sp. G2-8]
MRARVVASLAAVTVGVLLASPAMGSSGDSADSDEERPRTVLYEGPNAVTIPYLGETDAQVADGWQITDCARVLEQSDLIVDCTPEGFRAEADSYDPRYGQDVVEVPMTNGRQSTDRRYVVQLEPPEPPAASVTTYPHPAPSGGVLMIPLGDLGVTCAACDAGATAEVFSMSPDGSADVSATETYIVVRPRAAFEGELEIALRIADQFDGWSEQLDLVVPVSTPVEDPLVPLVSFREMPGAQGATIGVDELVAGDSSGVEVVGCGEPLHGDVACGADGGVRFRPGSGSDVDQLTVHLARGADLATASVTFVDADAETGLPTNGLAPTAPFGDVAWASAAELEAAQAAQEEKDAEEAEAAGEEPPPESEGEGSETALVGMRVATPLAFPAPLDEAAGSGGVFSAFVAVLDRFGSRE